MTHGSAIADLARGLVLAVGVAASASAVEFFDGRVELHGTAESTARLLNQDFHYDTDLASWRQSLDLELELFPFSGPIGFVDEISAFVRVEAGYDCVWTRACGLLRSADAYGDRAGKIPSKYTTGRRNGLVGSDPAAAPDATGLPFYHQRPPLNEVEEGETRVRTSRLVGIGDTPPFEILARNVSFETAFAPLLGHRFAIRQEAFTSSGGDSSGIDATVLPWRPKDEIRSLGSLASVANVSLPGLPARPALEPDTVFPDSPIAPQGLYHPSADLRRLLAEEDISDFDQNFSQSELAWDQGASQDESVLREAYVDVDLFDARLFLRVGKQTVVWGKTELFRNQDQINPSDLALPTLPDLEDSRISQWALRAIYSLWNVGPLSDVRLELVWVFDDFEPNDVGRCGEPFSPLPVCNKTFGLFQHGALGAGLAGETRPPSPWDDLSGHEIGGRIEWRWDRFSFAVSDFWHFEDSAHARIFNRFERRVDPLTGRPLSSEAPEAASCVTGLEPGCLQPGSEGPDNAFAFTPMNRQLFDVICASSFGFFAIDESVCAVTVTNSLQNPLTMMPSPNPQTGLTIAALVSATAAGNPGAAAAVGSIAQTPPVIPLNTDPCDAFLSGCVGGVGTAAPGQGFFSNPPPIFPDAPTLQEVLTDEQEALAGCGPFYSESCDVFGVDLFNAEASALFATWPGNPPGSPVATRFVDGVLQILPGARGPEDPGYDPDVDGCVANDVPGCEGAMELIDPRTGERFRSEADALSYNALLFVVALDLATLEDPDAVGCAFPTMADPTAPTNCPTVQDFFSVTATTRPDLRAGGNGRFGRRDFAWAGAGELVLEYEKVNTLGFSMDFTEDHSGTSWGVEFSWTPDRTWNDSESVDFLSESDLFALTVSVDRPTLIQFLNRQRTFFVNMQWFFEYIPDYVGGGGVSNHRGFEVEGPWTALGTLTVQTSYYQDRLIPVATYVHDIKSRSGGAVFRMTYRYSANASVFLGVKTFYGKGRSWRIPIGLGALGESNQTWRTERFTRLNAVRERDEVFVGFRYSF